MRKTNKQTVQGERNEERSATAGNRFARLHATSGGEEDKRHCGLMSDSPSRKQSLGTSLKKAIVRHSSTQPREVASSIHPSLSELVRFEAKMLVGDLRLHTCVIAATLCSLVPTDALARLSLLPDAALSSFVTTEGAMVVLLCWSFVISDVLLREKQYGFRNFLWSFFFCLVFACMCVMISDSHPGISIGSGFADYLELRLRAFPLHITLLASWYYSQLRFARHLSKVGCTMVALAMGTGVASLCEGIMLFQWVMLDPNLDNTEQIVITGIIFPLFCGSVGRVVVGDFVAFALLYSPESPGVWTSSRGLRVRAFYLTSTKWVTTLAQMVTLINVNSNGSFFASLVLSNSIEVLNMIGQYGLLSRLVRRRNKGTVQVAPHDLLESKSPDAAETKPDATSQATSNFQDAKKILTNWSATFETATRRRERIALSCIFEDRCERSCSFVSLIMLVYLAVVDDSETLKESALKERLLLLFFRAFVLLIFETFFVDVIKLMLLDTYFEVRPMWMHIDGKLPWKDILAVISAFPACIALLLNTKYAREQAGAPVNF